MTPYERLVEEHLVRRRDEYDLDDPKERRLHFACCEALHRLDPERYAAPDYSKWAEISENYIASR